MNLVHEKIQELQLNGEQKEKERDRKKGGE